jgi:hypothetical protein
MDFFLAAIILISPAQQYSRRMYSAIDRVFLEADAFQYVIPKRQADKTHENTLGIFEMW